jgi:hypothetical protein
MLRKRSNDRQFILIENQEEEDVEMIHHPE